MPYLLTLALTKFLLEFIKQPIRLGGQSVLLPRPKKKSAWNFISYPRSNIPFFLDALRGICACCWACKIDGEWVGALSVNFLWKMNQKWVGDGLENMRRMKRDSDKFRGFIPGTVSSVSRIFLHLLCRFLVYYGGVFNCLNKFYEPKLFNIFEKILRKQ